MGTSGLVHAAHSFAPLFDGVGSTRLRRWRCRAAPGYKKPGAQRPAQMQERGIFDLEGQCGDNVTLFDARCEVTMQLSSS